MKVLVVYAHANPESFNHAVLEAFTKGLEDGGHTFEVVDLYAIKFDPCLTLDEFAQFTRPLQTPKDVLDQQEKVAQADALAFIYPVIWMGFPAILKGWIERVFNYGFGYEVNEAGVRGDLKGRIGLLKHKKALLINTTHWSEESFKASGMQDAMEKIMVEYALKFPGVQQVEHVFLYWAIWTDDETRKGYLELAYRLGKEF